MADPIELGSRIKAIRVDRRMSREFVAAKLGCHKTNLAHIEANRQQPSVEQFRVLARLFDCSMEEMLEGPLPVEAAAEDDFSPSKHVTRDMTPEQITAQLDKREANEVEDALRRRGVELTEEQRRRLGVKHEAA